MQNRKIVSILAGFMVIAVVGTNCWAAKEQAAKKKYRGIAQVMRDAGFTAKSASWTAVVTQITEGGKTETSETKAWISGERYRMETKDKQKQQLQVMLDDGKEFYMYTPAEKKAMKVGTTENSMFSSILSSDVVAESARQRKTAKKVGSEVIEGKPCTIFAYQSTVTVMQSKVTSDVKEWVWSKENFPIKSIVKTPKHQMKIVFMTMDVPASETTTVVKDLVLNGSVDGNLFALPAGTTVETLEMPEGAMNNGQPMENSAAMEEKPKTGSVKGNSEKSGDEEQPGPPPVVKDLLKSLF